MSSHAKSTPPWGNGPPPTARHATDYYGTDKKPKEREEPARDQNQLAHAALLAGARRVWLI